MVQKPCKVDKKSQSKHTQIKKAKNKQEIKKKRKCGNFAEIKIFLNIRRGKIFICGVMKNQKGHDFFVQNILTQLGTIFDNFNDIRSLEECFGFSNL